MNYRRKDGARARSWAPQLFEAQTSSTSEVSIAEFDCTRGQSTLTFAIRVNCKRSESGANTKFGGWHLTVFAHRNGSTLVIDDVVAGPFHNTNAGTVDVDTDGGTKLRVRATPADDDDRDWSTEIAGPLETGTA
jgi:hypothetical protein